MSNTIFKTKEMEATAFCGKNGLKYQHFRNCLIAKIQEPPEPLADIMNIILDK